MANVLQTTSTAPVSRLRAAALGWQVGGPGAAERATMVTVLFVSNLGAALAGGALLRIALAPRL